MAPFTIIQGLLDGPPPSLPQGPGYPFTAEFADFCKLMLMKDQAMRFVNTRNNTQHTQQHATTRNACSTRNARSTHSGRARDLQPEYARGRWL